MSLEKHISLMRRLSEGLCMLSHPQLLFSETLLNVFMFSWTDSAQMWRYKLFF